MSPMSIEMLVGSFSSPACALEATEALSDCDRSSANIVISAMRWTKLAGLGALSALCVLKRSNNRKGCLSEAAGLVIADFTRARCAIDGGLKEESRI